ncbi:ABC transporter substrate-binding protein [Cephaloticoccus capnophilus]|uniref:ABC transporter substrate-binding protein n=1 Tax=Cephaloticoccus capnophilus TaxID=1548208 RepID=UPI0018D4334E|nr:extracellular solute-binding protein [Cephaloticoccus capnophilus]
MTTQPPPQAAPPHPSLREKLSRTVFSFGALVILAIAVVTSVIVALIPAKDPEGIPFWVMSTQIHRAYVPVIAEWNRKHPEKRFGMQLITDRAFERRMLSGFLAGTPVADLLELNDGTAPKAFLGPIDQVGFLDLTDRIHAEGLYEQFNEPSFSAFTSRGRIFGLPRSVHPVLLAYRADLVEAAGIDVSQIETWDDYFRIMRPLMADHDGNGRPDHYLLNLSENDTGLIISLLFQNDGLLFDENDALAFASPRNAHALATIVTWLTGPAQAAIDVPLFTAAGHRQRLEGIVIGMILPDWMLGSWKVENPQLAGKIKLMPLPAWERGGRRTTINGGTMIGINKRAEHIEQAWELAKHLYMSAELAEQSFRENSLITTVKALWSLPIYDEPEPYCGGQIVGRMYIDQAPHVPRKPSSPYAGLASEYVRNVTMALRAYAERTETYDVAALETEALRLLSEAQAALQKQIARNLFSQTP